MCSLIARVSTVDLRANAICHYAHAVLDKVPLTSAQGRVFKRTWLFRTRLAKFPMAHVVAGDY
jgi:hypothetical protein